MIRKTLLLLLLATPLAAQDAQLFIERIEVRNHKRVSPDVVVAESRLREGRAYTEDELRDASTRLGRLPFLLSVDFALEKGSERGKHVLVLTIHETKPFFFLLDAQQYFDAENRYVVPEDDSRSISGSQNLALGFRWFVGRRGAVHLGLTGAEHNRAYSREQGGFAAGYTQYDLFGTRAFATLNFKLPILPGEAKISPQVVVGVPLSANQTVTLQYDELRFEREARPDYESRFEQRVVSARWTHNTTNEPFFPTRGTLLYAGPVAGWSDGRSVYSITGGGVSTVATHSEFIGVEGGAARYFELTERDSVWGDVRAEWARNEVSAAGFPRGHETTRYGSIGAGYSHSLWSQEERANGGDSRLEITARFSNRSRYADPGSLILLVPNREVRQVGGAWLRRTSWGTLRLGVGYAW